MGGVVGVQVMYIRLVAVRHGVVVYRDGDDLFDYM